MPPCHRGRVWEVLVTAIAAALFVWQVELNVEVFLDRPTVFSVTIEADPNFLLPPVTVCPHPAFEPTVLRRLGANVSGNYEQVGEALFGLAGLNESLATAQLWQEAQWRFGQIVQMVMFGNVSVIYKEDATEAPHWRRSYSPLGPCFTFIPPPGETTVVIGLHNIPSVKRCSWANKQEQLVIYNGLPSQCDDVQKKCNSTCGFENYVLYRRSALKAAFVYFHTKSAFEALTQKDAFDFSNQLFEGSHVLKRLENIPNLRSQSQQIESSLVKGNCVPSAYAHSACYHKRQRSQALRKLGCLPVRASAFQDPINKTCSSPSLIQELFELEKQLKSCPHSCFQRRYKHVISETWGPEFVVVLEASTTYLREEKELETYPLAQLFSDIGGSLGLFLGVSILHVWNLGVRIGFANQKGDFSHAGKLLKHIGMLTACLATSTHCLQELKMFLSQPVLTSVSLGAPLDEADDLITALARRLASRALDCRPQEAPLMDCQIQCLLEGSAKEVKSAIPFISVEDLPPCKAPGFVIPSRDYVVPSETLMVASSRHFHSCIKSCEALHRKSNTSSFATYMHVDQHYRSYDLIRLICSIGGIVGLYLGYSAFQAVDLCDRIWCAGRDLNLHSVHIRRFLKFCIFLFGLVVAFLRSHRFLMQHQVSTSIIPSHTVPLVVTVCRWPPLNFSRLASYLGSNFTLDSILEKPLEQRQEAVLQLLESLEGIWPGSLEDLWSAAAWNITDVIGDMVAKHPAVAETASIYSATYEPLQRREGKNRSTDLSYETCVQRCVGDGLNVAFQCRLPYMVWRPDLSLCNQTQYSSIPRHFKGLEDVGGKFHGLNTSAEASSSLLSLEGDCFISCRHLRKTFYTQKTERVPSLYPSLTVRLLADTLRTRETATFTFAQFISDLGGIAGTTVGFSLLILLRDLLPRTKSSWNT
ncbi:hypothetical protein C7M84_014942 [Penaeus vannamei]|uniref:Uncharacterized protein n=1 Tax=Penaeus vannamei TaxID=6689 RepID=A0A423SS22_PENVA|nr:hypothetical protein C7M84_014942 [Penaeus vannamei]